MARRWQNVATGIVLVFSAVACRPTQDQGSANQAPHPQAAAARPSGAAESAGVVFPPGSDYLARDYRGHEVDLRAFRGKVVLMNFWATWCPPCRYEIPDLVRLREEFSPEEVAILGVSLDQGTDEQVQALLARFVAKLQINYPVLTDNRIRLLRQFLRRDPSSAGIPMTFVFDRKGRLFTVHEGLPQTSDGRPDPGGVLEQEIRQLLEQD